MLSKFDFVGFDALLNSVRTQLSALWFLGLGIAFYYAPRLTLLGATMYGAGAFLTTTGSRSHFAIHLAIPVLLYALMQMRLRRKKVALIILGLAIIGSLLILDVTGMGRQGLVTLGGPLERLERVLKGDLAFGNRALPLINKHNPIDTGIEYFKLLSGLVVPKGFMVR